MGRPPIVLVTIDTIRRDHLGCYGYFRDTSPALDGFADESVLFERAVVTMATTLPSHLSVLTGLYPHQHGFEENALVPGVPYESEPGRESAAVLLKGLGYRTAAFVSGRTISATTGIQDGFDTFEGPDLNGDFDAETTTARALEWLERGAGGPFFLWVHYWDPHEPNLPPEPYASLFAADERVDEELARRHVSASSLEAARISTFYRCRLLFPELLDAFERGERVRTPRIDAEAVRSMIDRYDADVRRVDDQLGRLFARLRAMGLWDSALVAVTGDHGQSLGQHDWLDHGRITNDNVLAPLAIRFPAGVVPQPSRVPQVVSLVDLMPTLLARLDGREVERFLEGAEGRDVFSGSFRRPFAFSQRSVRARDWEPGRVYSVQTANWKLFHRTEAGDLLFDLAADPGEREDVLAEHPRVAAALRRELDRVLARGPTFDPRSNTARPVPGDAHREALRELGYVDGDR